MSGADPRAGTPRRARVERTTGETRISLELNLDGTGESDCRTGIGFLDHMLTLFARHGLFDLTVRAEGDLEVDTHHTAEDVAIVLGRAFDRALGDRAGIHRTAHAYVPMDEALAFVAVDVSGRPWAEVDATFRADRLGELDSDLIRHMLVSLAMEARLNLHARIERGLNDHHRAEALVKALARALDAATALDPRRSGTVPSTKGVIDRGA